MGRPRKTEVDWPVYNNQQQAAVFLGWPPAVLKTLKAAGCPAFRSGKIYIGELIPWIGQRGMDDDIDWSARLKEYQAKREKLRLDSDERRLIDFATVESFHVEMLAKLFGDLDRIFCFEFPAAVKGLPEVDVRAKSVEAVAGLKAAIRTAAEALKD